MSRYDTTASELLSRSHQSLRFEKIVRAVHKAQTDNGVFSQKHQLPFVGVPSHLWEHHEKEQNHEISGWVKAWRETLPHGFPRSQTYLGLTSSNLIDCARALESGMLSSWFRLVGDEASQAANYLAWQMGDYEREGRTHGQIAHPVKRAATYNRFSKELETAVRALRSNVLPGALNGPTGNPDERVLNAEVRYQVSRDLGIRLDQNPTQIASRLQYLPWYQSLYQVVAVCEQLALYHRLESLPEISRFAEPFRAGKHRGSSSMPHKRNPARSERICGLARVARGHLQALTEAASDMWWERDLSNSSTERESYRGLVTVSAFVLQETNDLLQGTIPDHRGVEIPPQAFSSRDLITRQLSGQDPDEAYYELQSQYMEENK